MLGRDFTSTLWAEIAIVEPGDACPKCGAPLRIDRGIEVGHVFQLGTKYTEALDAHYTDEDGEQHPMVMGCYGIGVSRIIAAVVEEHHDEHGIAWPAALAPYDVHLIAMPGRRAARSRSREAQHRARRRGTRRALRRPRRPARREVRRRRPRRRAGADRRRREGPRPRRRRAQGPGDGERDEIPRAEAVARRSRGAAHDACKVKPPVSPMLAKLAREMPVGEQWSYEPKWDGFRCIVFRDGDEIELGSRNEKPLTRYFPDLIEPLLAALPDGAVVDGEIVIKTRRRPGLRPALAAHPPGRRAASQMLAEETPGRVRRVRPARRGQRPTCASSRSESGAAELEALLGDAGPQVHLTPITRDPDKAREWFETLRGRGARRRRSRRTSPASTRKASAAG